MMAGNVYIASNAFLFSSFTSRKIFKTLQQVMTWHVLLVVIILQDTIKFKRKGDYQAFTFVLLTFRYMNVYQCFSLCNFKGRCAAKVLIIKYKKAPTIHPWDVVIFA